MSELLPGVHVIDQADPALTHFYLLRDAGASYTLIDTGVPGADATLERYLAQHRIAPTAIKRILLTHLHLDHCGNLRRLVELTHARTFAHWIEAAFLAQRPAYDGPGMPPKEPVTIDEPFQDGATIDAAGGLVAYHTPGHTPGHTTFYHPERRILFGGDLFFGQEAGVVLTLPAYTHHTPTASISARRMAQLSLESLLLGHGGPYLHGAGQQLRPFATAP